MVDDYITRKHRAKNQMAGKCTADVVVLKSVFARMRGLLFSAPSTKEVLLVPCNDVHTIGMRYAIDVAFLDKWGHVLKVYHKVEPGCRLQCRSATAVLERASPSQAGSRAGWLHPGAYAGIKIGNAIQERITS